jgi:hypothetical protein
MQSYIEHVKIARAMISGRLRGVVKRPKWFDLVYTDVRSSKKYQVNLKAPSDGRAEVYVYMQHE